MSADLTSGTAHTTGKAGTEVLRELPAPDATLGDDADAVLALADDELMIGHRHSEWLGLSPFLEEDLTLASIGQDELGHARVLYAVLWPSLDVRDVAVMRRPAAAYRSSALVEAESSSWEHHLVRHLLHDLGEVLRWEDLAARSTAVAAVAAPVLAEERFHRRHAVDLVVRLAGGSAEAARRLQHELDELWPTALSSLAVQPRCHDAFVAAIAAVCGDAGLRAPLPLADGDAALADRTRRHDGFAAAHRSFTEVFAIDPDAQW